MISRIMKCHRHHTLSYIQIMAELKKEIEKTTHTLH